MNSHVPLAERIRPDSLDELQGQQHLAGKGSILRTAIEHGKIPSMIFWGPPGTGKTTIANIIAHTLKVPFLPAQRYQLRCKRCKGSDRRS
jgi:putative ATPase